MSSTKSQSDPTPESVHEHDSKSESLAAMSARPVWEGHLKLSLVSCPVALYNARRSPLSAYGDVPRYQLRPYVVSDPGGQRPGIGCSVTR